METVTDFIFFDLKITVDGDCSHEIQRHLFLGRKAMTNIVYKKQRHHLTNRDLYSQSCVFFQSLCADVRAGP